LLHGFFRLKEKGIRLKVVILKDLKEVLMKDIDKNFPLFPFNFSLFLTRLFYLK